MYRQLGRTRAMLCSISMKLARPIRIVSMELGKQLDVVQQIGLLVLPRTACLCHRVNDRPL
jgi:hypothetical protein